jgi:hypothetical protein
MLGLDEIVPFGITFLRHEPALRESVPFLVIDWLYSGYMAKIVF